MSWFDRTLGLDAVDLAIQATITAIGVAIATSVFSGPIADVLALKVVGISVLVLGWRRHRARKRMAKDGAFGLTSGEMAAERFQDLEDRVAELEAAQTRMAELEERLDFAERLLAQSPDKPAVLLEPGGPRG